MPDSSTSEPESDFVCDCEEWVRSACAGESFYREHEGKRYCVLHFPGQDKRPDFEKALQRKLENKDFDFRGVWFADELSSFSNFDFCAEANFSKATFNAEANFKKATFNAEANFYGCTFCADAFFNDAIFQEKACFNQTTFSQDVNFGESTFNGEAGFSYVDFGDVTIFLGANFLGNASFEETTFRARTLFLQARFKADACFASAIFEGTARFGGASFYAEAFFSLARFSKTTNFEGTVFVGMADFSGVMFGDYVSFAGEEDRPAFYGSSSLDFQFSRIENAARVSFHTVVLRPHWFVNVDARTFEFTNVDWDWRRINAEIQGLETKDVSSPHRLLAIACRNLAVNAEENHRYEEASMFRYMAMEARRLENLARPCALAIELVVLAGERLWGTSTKGVHNSIRHLVCRRTALHSRRLREMGAEACERK